MIDHAAVEPPAARQARRARLVAARFCGLREERTAPERAGDRDSAFAKQLAHQLAIYLANRVYRLPHSRTAELFGARPHAAANACRRIEVLREDPRFDWQVFEVETLLRAAELMDKSEGVQ